jgi:hypothetical protein
MGLELGLIPFSPDSSVLTCFNMNLKMENIDNVKTIVTNLKTLLYNHNAEEGYKRKFNESMDEHYYLFG